MTSLPRWIPLSAALLGIALVALLTLSIVRAQSDRAAHAEAISILQAEFASTTAAYEASLAERDEALVAAQSRNDSLAKSLAVEKERNDAVAGQVKEISDTVSTLSKLAETDAQLLAKYSKVYFLNENYSPAKISDIPQKYGNQEGRTYQFQSQALPFLEDLLEDARDDDVELLVASAYRSFGSQAALKSSYTVRYGTTAANAFSADQGYSEHQLGTALDFTTRNIGGGLAGFDKEPGFAWLKEHAHEYGFILSYPANNGFYVYEPWHWRFVGIKLATTLRDQKKNFYDIDQRDINTYLVNLFDK